MEGGETQVSTYDDDVLEGHGTEIPGFAVELDRENGGLKSLTHCDKEHCQRMIQHHGTLGVEGGDGLLGTPSTTYPKRQRSWCLTPQCPHSLGR